MVRLSLLLVLAAGCLTGGDNPLPDDFGTCTEPPAEGQPPPGAVTYYQHAKPIFDAYCGDCHSDGGIGPFALETFDDAFLYRNAIRGAVLSGAMPPWQPDDCCTDYRWDLSLPADARATILAWIEQGALAGDPAAEPPPLEVDRGGLPRVDAVVEMPEPFSPRPVIGADEVRCFLLDQPFDDEVFVRGINVVPGNRSMVHHVIVGAISPDLARDYEKKDGADGRPGWDCVGDLETDPERAVALGGWTPGSRGIAYPDGLGRKLKAGWKIALNMHYDTGTSRDPDQTRVELMVADEAEAEIKQVGIMNPLWLAEGAMPIAAGATDTEVFFAYDPTTVITKGRPFLVYAVNHHMHELGSIARIAILRADGTTDCLLNIGAWDFDWLGDYWLKEPIQFNPGDQLFIECHWDNTAGRQKIVDGEQIEPRDIDWGSDEEMCAGVLQVKVL